MTMFEVAIFLLLGFTAGTLFFALLRWNTSLYLHGGNIILRAGTPGASVSPHWLGCSC